MRIDLNASLPELPDPGPASKSAAPGAPESLGSSSPAGADSAQLSHDQGRVQDLVAQVSQLPEIRLDKVAALRQAVQSGSYSVTAAQSAEALISSLLIFSAA